MAEAGIEQAPNGAAADWKAPLAADPEIAPHLGNISEKDLPTFVKSHLNLQKKLGDTENRIKQEYAAKGLLRQAPEKYEIKRPDGLPEGGWNEQLEGKFSEVAKKHGLSQDAVNELLGLHLETFAGFGKTIEVNRAESEKKIVDWLAKTYPGATVEDFNETIKRFNANPLNGWDEATQQQLADSGLADYPLAAMAIYRLMKESGFGDTRNDGGSSPMLDDAANALLAEAKDIQSNPANAKNKLYNANDPATVEYVDGLYKRAYGDKEVIANEFLPKIIDRT